MIFTRENGIGHFPVSCIFNGQGKHPGFKLEGSEERVRLPNTAINE